MNIPRQFLGINYISKLVDNFHDNEPSDGKEMKFHVLMDTPYLPLEVKSSVQLSLNAKITADFIRDLAVCPECALDGIAIAKGEQLLLSEYRLPYSNTHPRITNSTCKTVTAIAVMFAISEDLLKIDDYVLSFFPEYENLLTPKYTKRITIRHLLTMTSCSKCNEIATVTETDWVKAFLLSDCQCEPGNKFIYNSMNTYMLSAIVTKVTGMGLMDYLKDRFFIPLGITDIKWELCPKGIERGGWGLHLSLEGMIKIGLFLANDGAFNGKQLMNPSYIKEMKRVNIHQDADNLATGYGLQLWHLPAHLIMLSGMFGQHVIIDEKTKLVVAMNAHTDRMFPDSTLVRKVIEYMTDPRLHHLDNRWKEQRHYRYLLQVVSAFQKGYCLKEDWNDLFYFHYCKKQETLQTAKGQKVWSWCKMLDGRRLHMNTDTFKLFPYMMQGMYTSGPFLVNDISFLLKEHSLKICFFKERNRKINEDKPRERILLEAGMNSYYIQTMMVGGVYMAVAAKLSPATDEDGHKVILFDIIFLEEGISRRIKFFPAEKRIAIECTEYPDMRAIVEQVISGDAVIAGNTYDIADKMPEGIRVLLEHKVEPRVYATLTDFPSTQK